jgi:hypothetical protein
MPNWCVNQVDVKGDEADVARLIELVKGDEDAFDFAKIVPVPDSPHYSVGEGQNDFLCGCKKVWVETKAQVGKYDEEGYEKAEGLWVVDGFPVVKEVLGNGTIKDLVSAGFGGLEVCPTHKVGQISSQPDWWYNWNVANWGTKWNCGDVWHDRTTEQITEEGRTSYNFDTAWSPASPVIEALAEQFPTLTITHRYCEAGMGFAGEVVYERGSFVSQDEYSSGNDSFPDEAWYPEEDGSRGYERNYDKVPMTAFESFCDEHFGGVVGG